MISTEWMQRINRIARYFETDTDDVKELMGGDAPTYVLET